MIRLIRFSLFAAVAFVGGCVTYPYATNFASCDADAGACYRECEAYAEGEGYGACHASCEAEANQCFDAAYAPYRYGGASYAYGYGSPWYGSYGAWYPQSGYVVSFGVVQRYGYRAPRYGYSYGRDDDRRGDGRRRDDRGDGRRPDGDWSRGDRRRYDGPGEGRGRRGDSGRDGPGVDAAGSPAGPASTPRSASPGRREGVRPERRRGAPDGARVRTAPPPPPSDGGGPPSQYPIEPPTR